MEALRLIPLGGFGEIGKNMLLLDCRGQLLLIDAGIAFPDEEQALGAELLIPNFSYLREHAERLVGIVLTHGHEDHIGGLPYVLREISAPVYGTPLTLGLVRAKLGQHHVEPPEMHRIERGDRLTIGCFDIECIRVNHSIPDCLALGIRTPAGTIVHSGDFKFDHTPIDGEVTDFAAFARLGDEGVRLLISDSTNIDKPGHTPSEAIVGDAFRQLFHRCPGRIIVATFASQIHRIQQVVDVAAEEGRKVLVAGRSMERNVNVARELGYLEFADDARIGYGDLPRYRDDEVVILITGSQGEPVSGLTRMAHGTHPKLRIHPDDTVVLSATPIPGNEATIWRIINELEWGGAEVVDHRSAAVHVSGHASAEEIKLLFNLLRPAYAVPFHGEYRHMRQYGELAQDVGLTHDRIFLLQNGDVLRLDAGGAALEAGIEHGTWTIEGRRINELGTSDQVVQDRIFLAESGVICGALVWDFAAGELVGTPHVAVRGVRLPEVDPGTLLEQAAWSVISRLDTLDGDDRHQRAAVERAGRKALRTFFEKSTRTYPVLEFQVIGLHESRREAVLADDEALPSRRAILTVDGNVGRPLSLTHEALAALPGAETPVGWDVEAAAAPLRAVLDAADLRAGCVRLVASGLGETAVTLPLAELLDRAMIVYGAADQPLAEDEGGPTRLVVPNGDALVDDYPGVTRLTAE